MTNPTVSVVIITYNHERYIEQAVKSVLAQRADFDVEVVIGEDASTDATRQALRSMSGEQGISLTVIERDKNVGMQANFATTYSVCQGKYVAILEGDDYWSRSDKLAKQVAAMEENPHWSLCFHRAGRVDDMSRRCGRPFPWRVPRETTTEHILSANYVPTCSILLRRSAVPVLPAWWCESDIGDWPLCILASEKGVLGFLSEVMACYRLHSASGHSSKPRLEQYVRSVAMVRLLRRHFAERHAGPLLALEAKFLLGAAREMARAGSGEQARRMMLDAFEVALLSVCDEVPPESQCDKALAAAGFIASDPLSQLLAKLTRVKMCQWSWQWLRRLWPRCFVPD